MNSQISELIQSFETDSKVPKKRYNDFITYVYVTFDKNILLCKSNAMVNKYKKIRTSILQYIIANEREITTEICKHK